MSVMDITILGRNGSIQDGLSGNSSLLLSCEDSSVLIDCSSNLQEAVAKDDLKAVVLTHSHVDHLYGFPSLIHQLWLKGRKEALDVYAKPETQEVASALLEAFHLREKKGMFDIIFKFSPSFSIFDLEVEFFDIDHVSGSIGVVFTKNGKKVVYTSDTRPIANPKQSLIGADLLITEASGLLSDLDVLIKKGHQSGVEAANLAIKIKANRLLLVHLPCEETVRDAIEMQTRRVFSNASVAMTLAHYKV